MAAATPEGKSPEERKLIFNIFSAFAVHVEKGSILNRKRSKSVNASWSSVATPGVANYSEPPSWY